MLDEFIKQLLGLPDSKELKKRMGSKEVVVEAFPKEAANALLALDLGIKVVEGKKPDAEWKVPYIKIYGDVEGRLNYYGPVKFPLTYGLGEVIVEASHEHKKSDLPAPVKVQVFVVAGTPCYKALKFMAPALCELRGLEVDVIYVDSGQRYKMFEKYGTGKVPTYVCEGKVINVGPLSTEEFKSRVLKCAADKAFEIAKKKLLEEKRE